MLGYRSYSPSGNRILGGYLAYDMRDTGESIFNQIGAGFETLGDDWDIRANAYIPVGNTRNQISESFGAAFFQQNSLRLQRVRQFEAAMTGGDVEAGGRLLALGDGDLRGYAGVYYYSAEGSEGVFGVRARLIARPTDYLGLSVSVQNDRLFDTSVVLSAAVNFPSSRPRGVKTPSALARIGESVERQTAIVADEQRKTDTVAASRPDSRNPLCFLHVSLGSATGTGSFEKPFGSVAEALGAAQSGDIVYLQSGSNPGVPGFKIPDGVSVLSTAPVQQIDTAQRSAVVLPLSGTGVLPAVTGTVTLGNNSTVSGLAISVPDDGSADTRNPGIAGSNISNPTIRDNTISSSDGSGILLNGVSGQLEIASNTISNSAGDGIRVNITGTSTVRFATIANNTISNSRSSRGIRVDTLDSSQVQQLSVAENTVTGSFFQGILVNSGGSSTLGQVSITSNRISDSGAAGILASLGENSRTEQVAIESNTIDSSDALGIWILPSGSARAGSVTIRSNTISNSGLNRNPTSNPDFDFTGFLNGIEVNAEDSEDSGIERLLIESNNVVTSAENGISIKAATSLRLLSGVRLNTITGSGSFGAVAETVKTGNLCLQLRENTSDRGFQLRQTSGTLQVEDVLIFIVFRAFRKRVALVSNITKIKISQADQRKFQPTYQKRKLTEMDREFKDAAWYQALALGERIELGAAGQSNKEFDANLAERRLKKWRSQAPFDSQDWWQARLAVDNLT
ncbi:MAG: right-handed parallel beta-helix repeat-containing protein [Oscillatoria sp. Prado101]|nr:right-handed parallel beta-helix repeat-containing protein [Oscillatoria sp. Prado101]